VGVKPVGVFKTAIFSVFCYCVARSFRDKTSAIYYIAFTNPKIDDLDWPSIAN